MEIVRSIYQFFHWFQVVSLGSYPILREKVVEMERPHPRGNFHLGFEVSHLQLLSNNWFFRVNGKQPMSFGCFSRVA